MRRILVTLMLAVALTTANVASAQPLAIAGRVVTLDGTPIQRATITLAASDAGSVVLDTTTPNFDGLYMVSHAGVQPGTKLYLLFQSGASAEPIMFDAPAGGGPVRTLVMAPIIAIAETATSSLTPKQAAYATASVYKTAEIQQELGLLTPDEAAETAARRSGYAIARVDGELNDVFPAIRTLAIEIAGDSLSQLTIAEEMILEAAQTRIQQRETAIAELNRGTISPETAAYVLNLQPYDIDVNWIDTHTDHELKIKNVFTKLGVTLNITETPDAEVLIFSTGSYTSGRMSDSNRMFALTGVPYVDGVQPVKLKKLGTEDGYREWLENNPAARNAVFFTSILDQPQLLNARIISDLADRLDQYEIHIVAPQR